MCEKKTETERECVCVCVRERERERERERGKEREKRILNKSTHLLHQFHFPLFHWQVGTALDAVSPGFHITPVHKNKHKHSKKVSIQTKRASVPLLP